MIVGSIGLHQQAERECGGEAGKQDHHGDHPGLQLATAEIGAIRVAANESYFQVSERAKPGFIKALRRANIEPEDQGLVIELAEPREQKSTYRPELAHEKSKPRKKNKKEKRPPGSRRG